MNISIIQYYINTQLSQRQFQSLFEHVKQQGTNFQNPPSFSPPPPSFKTLGRIHPHRINLHIFPATKTKTPSGTAQVCRNTCYTWRAYTRSRGKRRRRRRRRGALESREWAFAWKWPRLNVSLPRSLLSSFGQSNCNNCRGLVLFVHLEERDGAERDTFPAYGTSGRLILAWLFHSQSSTTPFSLSLFLSLSQPPPHTESRIEKTVSVHPCPSIRIYTHICIYLLPYVHTQRRRRRRRTKWRVRFRDGFAGRLT